MSQEENEYAIDFFINVGQRILYKKEIIDKYANNIENGTNPIQGIFIRDTNTAKICFKPNSNQVYANQKFCMDTDDLSKYTIFNGGNRRRKSKKQKVRKTNRRRKSKRNSRK